LFIEFGFWVFNGFGPYNNVNSKLKIVFIAGLSLSTLNTQYEL